MTLLWVFWGFLLGAALGSFFSAALWRRQEGLSLIGRSFCPACQKEIPARWNVPLLSWLLLKGRSRCCQSKLDSRDLAWEVLGAASGAAIGAIGGPLALVVFFLVVLISALVITR